MKRLTKDERATENALLAGEFSDVSKAEFEAIAKSLVGKKRDAVLSIRVNKQDLKNIKLKAKQYGIAYQTLISEWLHRIVS